MMVQENFKIGVYPLNASVALVSEGGGDAAGILPCTHSGHTLGIVGIEIPSGKPFVCSLAHLTTSFNGCPR